jgi:hypothetical protein
VLDAWGEDQGSFIAGQKILTGPWHIYFYHAYDIYHEILCAL